MEMNFSNLVEPMTFTEAEVGNFVKKNSCGLCKSHLYKQHAPDRMYTVHCPNCGPIYEHMPVSKHTIEQINASEAATRTDMAASSNTKRTVTEILAEIGF